MRIRCVHDDELDAWVNLRLALWPECEIDALAAEAHILLARIIHDEIKSVTLCFSSLPW